MSNHPPRPIEILLVEDNETDVLLTRTAIDDAKVRNTLLHVVDHGASAMQFLRREGNFPQAPRPDLILLDLNLPRMDGREVLAEIKSDSHLKRIPVVVLTTSTHEKDILKAYNLHANCYITKPLDFEKFTQIIHAIEHFWISIVTLPPR